MKKIVVFVFLCIGFVNLYAQNSFLPKVEDHDHKGTLFLGGAINFWKDLETKKTTFELSPEVGWLFNKTWRIGILLGYQRENEKSEEITVTENSFKISPFLRYYYYHKGPFNLFVDGGAGINFRNNSASSKGIQGFEVGVRPGACADLIEGLCLCLRMGFLGYRKNYFSGEEPHLGNTGFGMRFAPEELMIGLELEI